MTSREEFEKWNSDKDQERPLFRQEVWQASWAVRQSQIDKLIGYARHDDLCPANNDKVCTCGLSDLIRELRGE